MASSIETARATAPSVAEAFAAALPRTARLEVLGLYHRLGGRAVLDRLSFRVQPGEIFGLLGPNGSGKSTTLRVLTGLLVPDAGELLLDGRPVGAGGRRLRQRHGRGVPVGEPRHAADRAREPAARRRALRRHWRSSRARGRTSCSRSPR